MTEPIKLPPEFRSGNSIPVERATITRERMIEILAAAIEADRQARGEPVAWENFPGYLIDHCEGEVITEEGLQRALADMLADPRYSTQQQVGEPVGRQHPDDAAVDAFAPAMKGKLAKKRAEGRGGWQSCDAAYLSDLLREHVEKGDPVDVANLAMMLHQNGQSIQPAAQPQQQASEPVAWLCTPDFEGEQFLATTQGAADTLEKDGWSVQPLYEAPQPQQIPKGYKLVPIESTAQNIEGEGIVETVTKAILFADCGSTEDWQDNLYLGEAVLQALVPHLPPEMGASEWAELHILRAERGPSDGGHKTWKEAAIAERRNRVLMTPRKEIVALAKEGLSVYTGPNMNEHKICAEIVRLSAMLEAAPEPKEPR